MSLEELHAEINTIDNSEASIKKLKQSIKAFHNANKYGYELDAQYNLAKRYYLNNQFDKSKEILDTIFYTTKSQYINESFFEAYNLRGIIEGTKSANNVAIFYFNEGLKILKKHKKNYEYKKLHLNIAISYIYNNNFLEALKHLELIDDSGIIDDAIKIYKYNYLLQCYLYKKDTAKVQECFEILQNLDSLNIPSMYYMSINNLYIYYTFMKNNTMKEKYSTIIVEKFLSNDYKLEDMEDIKLILRSYIYTNNKDFHKIAFKAKEFANKNKHYVLKKNIIDLEIDFIKQNKKEQNCNLLLALYEDLNQTRDAIQKEEDSLFIENYHKQIENKILREKYEESLKKEIQLKEKAYFDNLTNLRNRHALRKDFDAIISKKNYAIFIFDLDNFKTINDSYGHQTGDKVLIDFANALRLFESDKLTAYRLGGDEFLIIIKDTNIEKTSELIEALTEKRCKLSVDTLNYNFSFGSFFAEEKTEYSIAMSLADKSLYENKKSKAI